MPYEYVLLSPEKVEIRYEIGGLGSRALAAVLDDLLVLLLNAVVLLILTILEDTMQLVSTIIGRIGEGWALAGLLFFAFISWFAYYILFEIWWNGQTPAKRAFGLRVIRLDGTPATPGAILTRELVRLVDAFPLCLFGYNVAGLVAFFNPYGQRLGDMLAGTFVIKERRVALPTLASLSEIGAGEHPLEIYVPTVLALSANEYRALRAFLERREQFPVEVRERLANELYEHLIGRLGLAVPPDVPHEGILEAIATRYARERGRLE
jgi:uncharacterized RDD family membrane protein YckC